MAMLDNINQLPDDCLLSIFQRLPTLRQRIKLERVCRRWKAIQELACRSQKSLHLYCCTYRFDESYLLSFSGEINANAIRCNMIIDSVCDILLQKFPSITCFGVYGSLIGNPRILARLLSGWSERLQTLTLHLYYGSFYAYSDLTDEGKALTATFATLQSLRHLYINMQMLKHHHQFRPTLRQLRTFYITDANNTDLAIILPYIGSCIEALHFVTVKPHLDWQTLRKNIDENVFIHHLPHQLRRLTLCNVDRSMLQMIADHFFALSYLDISLNPSETLQNILPDLQRMKRVIELRLRNPSSKRFGDRLNSNFFCATFFPFYKTSPRNYQRRLPQLVNVRRLYTDFALKPIRVRYLRHIFPSLKRITFESHSFYCECQFVQPRCVRCALAILSQINTIDEIYHRNTPIWLSSSADQQSISSINLDLIRNLMDVI